MRLPYKEDLKGFELEAEVAELLKETGLTEENIAISPTKADKGVRFNIYFIVSPEELALIGVGRQE